MPELPGMISHVSHIEIIHLGLTSFISRKEVERAARLFHERGNGKIISKIETTEDTIVYQGTTHSEFVSSSRCQLAKPFSLLYGTHVASRRMRSKEGKSPP